MLTEKIGTANSIEDVNSGYRVDAKAQEFYIAHSGSIVCAGRDSVIVAKEYSFVIAESGSRVVALPGSFIVKEDNAFITELEGSFVIKKQINKINPPIYFARKQNESYPDHSFVMAYPGSKFKTGCSSTVFAPSKAEFEMDDFSCATAKDNCLVTIGHGCVVNKLDDSVRIKRKTYLDSTPKHIVIEG